MADNGVIEYAKKYPGCGVVTFKTEANRESADLLGSIFISVGTALHYLEHVSGRIVSWSVVMHCNQGMIMKRAQALKLEWRHNQSRLIHKLTTVAHLKRLALLPSLAKYNIVLADTETGAVTQLSPGEDKVKLR